MLKNKLTLILSFLLIVAVGVIVYQNVFTSSTIESHEHESGKQLYTCGMHPNIIEEEPGNCPICGMKLVPVKNGDNKSADGEKKILYWRAPMDPNEIYDEPGKSKMGMDLVPVYSNEAGQSGVVTINGELQQQMNLKTAMVERRTLQKKIFTNGVITTDERKEFILNTKVSGWIEKLYINYTGQEIKKGEKLLDIYSPELVSAQEEVLTAVKYNKSLKNSSNAELRKSGEELLKNSLRKLKLLDIPERDIDALINSGKVKKVLTLYAPFNGVVLHKNISEGEKVMAGMTLMHIANLNSMWLKADIYENELPLISVGSPANITLNYFPGEVLKDKISFIYPTVDPKTRTIQVRFNLPNKSRKLKPSMFATIEIRGKALKNVLTIPEEAVIRSGKNAIAVILLKENKFKPVNITLGQYAEGYYQVLEGLTEGTKVVTNAQFLIDSESNLRSAVNKFQGNDNSSGSMKDGKQNTDDMNGKMNMNDDKSDSMEMDNSKTNSMKMEDKESHDMDMNKEMDNHKDDSNMVRKGVIDLKIIDKNKDGMVYQDMMDWNVISDKEGRCPICEMKLSEVSLDQARENLLKNGFQVK